MAKESQSNEGNRMTQMKLTTDQIGKLKQARNGILSGIPWLAIDEAKDFWRHALNGLDAKIKHGTSDGKPFVDPEPPLTDQDACVWPRLLVMVRDESDRPWEGPRELQGVSRNGSFRYPTNDPKNGICEVYCFARRATPAEIEAANDNS